MSLPILAVDKGDQFWRYTCHYCRRHWYVKHKDKHAGETHPCPHCFKTHRLPTGPSSGQASLLGA